VDSIAAIQKKKQTSEQKSAAAMGEQLHERFAQTALQADGTHVARRAFFLFVFDQRNDHACLPR
jgi:hypothetical protein